MLKRERWLNKEVGVFLGSSTFLFCGVLWCAFSGPPLREWDPVSVRTGSPDWVDLALETSEGREVLLRYRSGRRQNPFLPVRRRAIAIGPIKPRLRPLRPTDIFPKRPGKVKPPPPKPELEKKKPEPKVVKQAKPWEMPMEVKGAWSLEGGETFALFESKETGEYWNVREGDEIAELGVKVVKVTPTIIIVENEKGERLRLRDLIRASRREE